MIVKVSLKKFPMNVRTSLKKSSMMEKTSLRKFVLIMKTSMMVKTYLKKFVLFVKTSLRSFWWWWRYLWKVLSLFPSFLSLFFTFFSLCFFISFLLISLDDDDGDISELQPKASLTFEFIWTSASTFNPIGSLSSTDFSLFSLNCSPFLSFSLLFSRLFPHLFFLFLSPLISLFLSLFFPLFFSFSLIFLCFSFFFLSFFFSLFSVTRHSRSDWSQWVSHWLTVNRPTLVSDEYDTYGEDKEDEEA